MYTSTIYRLRPPRFIRLQEILSGTTQIHSFAAWASSRAGAGGERHQQTTNGALLTTNQGALIADNQIR
jgi:hypothetical protein